MHIQTLQNAYSTTVTKLHLVVLQLHSEVVQLQMHSQVPLTHQPICYKIYVCIYKLYKMHILQL